MAACEYTKTTELYTLNWILWYVNIYVNKLLKNCEAGIISFISQTKEAYLRDKPTANIILNG